MRTRQKFTAVGALTMAASAIGGGALVTSHAMAADAAPSKGTITVVSLGAGDESPIECTFDEVDLPTLPVLADGGELPGGVGFGTDIAVSGTLTVTEASSADGPSVDGGPTLVQAGTAPIGAVTPLMVDTVDARPGTDAECAALRPDFTATVAP